MYHFYWHVFIGIHWNLLSHIGLTCKCLSAGHQHSAADWVHQCSQNQSQSRHHQCWDSLQGKSEASACCKYDLMCCRAVLTCLTLLSAHGAHHSWHRGPLWTVEPPLLEGQVRQRQFIVIQTGLSAEELKRGGSFRPQFLSAWFRLTVLLFAVWESWQPVRPESCSATSS